MRILALGDLHFGHRKISTKKIITDLERDFLPIIKDNDLVVITGDIFDKTLLFSCLDSRLVIAFFLRLFRLLQSLNCTLRIIRGTISHDGNQIGTIASLYKEYNFTFDFKYFNIIGIEYIEKFQKSFLYLPDNLPCKNAGHVIRIVKDKLRKLSMNKVDYVICHGTFRFALPFKKLKIRILYTRDIFKDIVNEKIICGHIHIPRTKANVIYTGSFDKLIFNERGKRGFFIIENDKVVFIENKNMSIFEDVSWCDKFDKIESLKTIVDKLYKHQNYRGYIRFVNAPYDRKQGTLTYFYENFPNISVDFVNSKYLNKELDNINKDLLSYSNSNLTIPTTANLSYLISEFISKKYNKIVSKQVIDKYLILEEEVR
jgi:DNA repair exonuclease SbcCD nuclease subunit